MTGPVETSELLADMQRVARLVEDGGLTQLVYRALGRYSPMTVARRFGGWNRALGAAGLPVVHEYRIDDVRLFANLQRVWLHLGRQPRCEEVDRPPSTVSGNTYRRRFGSWNAALAQFVAYANGEESEVRAVAPGVSGQRQTRGPSLNMRFRVMKRDNFTCRACGASPAAKPGTELHVDHIRPVSRGGVNAIDNLQTLCEACNLGKSDDL